MSDPNQDTFSKWNFSSTCLDLLTDLVSRCKYFQIQSSKRIIPLTPEMVMLMLLIRGCSHKGNTDYLAAVLAKAFSMTEKDLEQALAEKFTNASNSAELSSSIISSRLEEVFGFADNISRRVSAKVRISQRHLIAALLYGNNRSQISKSGMELPASIFRPNEFVWELEKYVKSSPTVRSKEMMHEWEIVIAEIRQGIPQKPIGEKISTGGAVNFSREASLQEVCLKADIYAAALKHFLVASQNHGDLCFALFGHWGRGKSFLMKLTEDLLKPELPKPVEKRNAEWRFTFYVRCLLAGVAKMVEAVRQFTKGVPGYGVVRFSAWKYPNVPEVWVHLYEMFAKSAHPTNPIRSIPRIFRAGIAKHGGGKIIMALALLAFALYPQDEVKALEMNWQDKVKLAMGAGGLIWLTALLSGAVKTTKRLSKDFLTTTSHRDKLGLQATIGEDLEALLKGWMPRQQNVLGGWLFWLLAVAVFLVAGSGWWRVHGDNPLAAPVTYILVGLTGMLLVAYLLFTSRGPARVLLVVDDLDRCKGEQLLVVVESIKVLLEEPEISSRIQVVMLVEEEVLEQAIQKKYKEMGERDEENKIGLNWSREQICRENFEKLFTAHFRLPPLAHKDLEEIMSKVVTKERPKKDGNTKHDSGKPVPSTVPRVAVPTPGAQPPTPANPMPAAPDGTQPPAPAGSPAAPQLLVVKELVFTEGDEKVLIEALPELEKACQDFRLGPRSIRAFAFRYQLARLLLRQLGVEPDPKELAVGLAQNASYGKKTQSPSINKSLLERIIEQVA